MRVHRLVSVHVGIGVCGLVSVAVGMRMDRLVSVHVGIGLCVGGLECECGHGWCVHACVLEYTSVSTGSHGVCPISSGLLWMWQTDALTPWVFISLLSTSPGARALGLSLQTPPAHFPALRCTRVGEHGGAG